MAFSRNTPSIPSIDRRGLSQFLVLSLTRIHGVCAKRAFHACRCGFNKIRGIDPDSERNKHAPKRAVGAQKVFCRAI